MTKKSKQEIERFYFERFCKDYELPPGTIIYGDKPDVILKGEKVFGIEITNFFLEKGKLLESEQVQSKIREEVVSEAQRFYQVETKKKIELSLGFDKNYPIRDKNKLIQKIIELARKINGTKTGQIRRDIYPGIPEISFVYLSSKEFKDTKWKVIQVHEGKIMLRDGLIGIVRDKEDKSKQYRKCDAYWLLVIVEFFDPAQDQEIRIDDFEKIQSEIFEKIIVYKPLFRHVLEAK